jgi:RNA polymerase sigma factor (sigma-70 family)
MFVKDLFEAKLNEVAIIFGRFNPPHKGHKAAWELASKSPNWYVGTNANTRGPKDPLPYEVKVKAMIAIWPEVEKHIVAEQSWLTLASRVYQEHGDVTLKVCTDEAWVLKTIEQYNGVEGKNHGFYNFSKIVGTPTPRLSSATALRKAVADDDRDAFSIAAGVDADTEINGESFFNLVQKYLGEYNKAKEVAESVVNEESPLEGFKRYIGPKIFKKNYAYAVKEMRKLAKGSKEGLGSIAQKVAGYVDKVDYRALLKLYKEQHANVNEWDEEAWTSRYNPDGKTYRGIKNKMPTLDDFEYDQLDPEMPSDEDPYTSAEQGQRKEKVMALLDSGLTANERAILMMRFGLGKYEPMTLDQIGKMINLSADRVRVLEQRALRKLRVARRADTVADFAEIKLKEMAKMTKTDIGFGLSQYINDAYALVGGARSGSSNPGETRVKYDIYSVPIAEKHGPENAKIGAVEFRVSDKDGEILGLINIELDKALRGKGHGKAIIQDIKDTTQAGAFDVHDIQKKAQKFWDAVGIVYKNKQKTQGRVEEDMKISDVVEGEKHGNSKIYDKCWDGYEKVPGKKRGEAGSCRKISEEANLAEGDEITIEDVSEIQGIYEEAIVEAEYQGRKVKLNKPMQGDVKKFKVYVKNDKGNVVKVNFGDPNMRIKKSNPKRRKSFRARHNCDNPGPKWKARYWSCRKW